MPFLEAIRQFRNDVGRDNVCYVHVTLVPGVNPSGELKTKPTQHSVTELRARGIQPDAIVCRSAEPLAASLKDKLSNMCDVPIAGVVNASDATTLYEIPLNLRAEGFDDYVCKLLHLDGPEPDLAAWRGMVERIKAPHREVRIGIIGKYVSLPDAYLSVIESLYHAGFHFSASVDIELVQAEEVPMLLETGGLRHLDGIVIPGGFGERGIEGKIAAAHHSRVTNVPCLGICLGLQVMTIEFGRHVLGLADANSREFDPASEHCVIELLDEQRNVSDKGGTMRLGAYDARLCPGSQVHEIYGVTEVSERHRHRFEFNPNYRQMYTDAGFAVSGVSPDGKLVEFTELPGHPFWVGTQAHPEFKSRPDRPAPLFREFIRASLEFSEGRNPHLAGLE